MSIRPWEERGDDFERKEGNAKWYVAAMAAEIAELRAAVAQECPLPPAGWRCTRQAGHDGPCAAVVVK